MRSRLFGSTLKKAAENLPSVALGVTSSVATGYCIAQSKQEEGTLVYNPAGCWISVPNPENSTSAKLNK